MRITSWNIQHGELYGPDKSLTFEHILDGIEATGQSDIYAFQEVDCRLPRSGAISQPEVLARIAGNAEYAFGAGVIGTPGQGGRNVLAHEKELVRNGDTTFSGYGNLLLSRIPVKQWLRCDLGHSPIGMPLTFPVDGKMKTFYCKDENRVAVAAVLENGFTVINTHLSFVPGPSLFQLWNLMRWARKIERKYGTKAIIVGDLNLPGGIPQKFSSWRSLRDGFTFPQWKPTRQLDYFLIHRSHTVQAEVIEISEQPFSDHVATSIRIQ